MKRTGIYSLFAAFAAFVLLSGCSVGGKGPPLEYYLEAEPVRTWTGGEAPAIADEDIVPTLENRLDTANRLVSGDYIVNYSEPVPVEALNPELEVAPVLCAEDACTRYRVVNSEPTSDDVSAVSFSYGEYRGVATRAGVTLLQGAAVVHDPGEAYWNHWEYGGWLEHSAFFAQYSRARDSSTRVEMAKTTSGYSFGYATGDDPVLGDATWKGVMVGVDGLRDGTRGLVIQGDATITVDGSAAGMTADIAFTNIHDITTGGHHVDMTWNGVPVSGGGFAGGTPGDSIVGTFYGPDQEEVGGAFERDLYVGAFGARRD